MTRCCLLRQGGGLFAARSYTFSLDMGLAEPGDSLASTARRAHKLHHASYRIVLADAFQSSDTCVGKLKSDASATEYVLYGPGVNAQKVSLWNDERDELDQHQMVARQQLAAVSYSRTVVGRRRLLLPRTYGPRSMTCEVVTAEQASCSLRNKPPEWDTPSRAWVLDFDGRAPTVSSKNFQLCLATSGDVVLQLGKVGRNSFTVDYTWPLTGLQAFGIALSAFDQKRSTDLLG